MSLQPALPGSDQGALQQREGGFRDIWSHKRCQRATSSGLFQQLSRAAGSVHRALGSAAGAGGSRAGACPGCGLCQGLPGHCHRSPLRRGCRDGPAARAASTSLPGVRAGRNEHRQPQSPAGAPLGAVLGVHYGAVLPRDRDVRASQRGCHQPEVALSNSLLCLCLITGERNPR